MCQKACAVVNVLVVTQFVIPHSGGLSSHILDLIAQLHSLGHTTSLIHGGDVLPARWRRALGLLTVVGNRDRQRTNLGKIIINRLSDRIRSLVSGAKPFDVIHAHDPLAAAAAWNAIGSALPIVETIHGPFLYESRMGATSPKYESFVLNCEHLAFGNAAHFIAVDSGQADILARDYKVDRRRISVIWNAVDAVQIQHMSQVATNWNGPENYFLVPRRLVVKTGVRFAILAFARLLRSDAHLVIAGDGPLRTELEQLAKESGAKDRIHFLGALPRQDLIPLVRGAIAVLVPSIPSHGVIEATSIAVSEAMACATVPIASNIGGLAELIEHDQTGILVPPENPEKLAQAMQRVLDEPSYRAALSRNALNQVNGKLSIKSWISQITNVYCTAGVSGIRL